MQLCLVIRINGLQQLHNTMGKPASEQALNSLSSMLVPKIKRNLWVELTEHLPLGEARQLNSQLELLKAGTLAALPRRMGCCEGAL